MRTAIDTAAQQTPPLRGLKLLVAASPDRMAERAPLEQRLRGLGAQVAAPSGPGQDAALSPERLEATDFVLLLVGNEHCRELATVTDWTQTASRMRALACLHSDPGSPSAEQQEWLERLLEGGGGCDYAVVRDPITALRQRVEPAAQASSPASLYLVFPRHQRTHAAELSRGITASHSGLRVYGFPNQAPLAEAYVEHRRLLRVCQGIIVLGADNGCFARAIAPTLPARSVVLEPPSGAIDACLDHLDRVVEDAGTSSSGTRAMGSSPVSAYLQRITESPRPRGALP